MITATVLPEAYDVEKVSAGALVPIGGDRLADAVGDLMTTPRPEESHNLGDAPVSRSVFAGADDGVVDRPTLLEGA